MNDKVKILTSCFLLLVTLLYNGQTTAQTAVEPYAGYSVDLYNREHFSQINTGIQLAFINKPVYKMLVSLQGSFPLFPHAGTDAAFTADPGLSLSSFAKRKSGAHALSMALSHRFRMGDRNKKNSFSAVLNFGLAEHRIRVRYYGYDKKNYTVLNPHIDYKEIGVFFSAGVHYDRKFNDGRLFAQLTAGTPLLVKWNNYYYRSLAPLSLNIGYGFDIEKKNARASKK